MIQLSKRLQAVADLLQGESSKQNTFACVADVGTDHGYIPMYLVTQGICKRAIAMDINKGPLQRAKDHIYHMELEEYIDTRLSDGLVALEKGEADVIVIAGMGGRTMQAILENGEDVIAKDTVLLLQPQSELFEFRSYLQENCFEILQEEIVKEDGKYYPMMKVMKSSKYPEKNQEKCYEPWELFCGPLLLKKRHPVLKELLEYQMYRKKEVLEQLEQSKAREERKKEIQWEIDVLQQGLAEYERGNTYDL